MTSKPARMYRVGQNHTFINIHMVMFSKKVTIRTVIYGADIRFWPTLRMCSVRRYTREGRQHVRAQLTRQLCVCVCVWVTWCSMYSCTLQLQCKSGTGKRDYNQSFVEAVVECWQRRYSWVLGFLGQGGQIRPIMTNPWCHLITMLCLNNLVPFDYNALSEHLVPFDYNALSKQPGAI
jgi:hypothetical protein